MKIDILNKLLGYINFNFIALNEIYSSGQRIVYKAQNKILMIKKSM